MYEPQDAVVAGFLDRVVPTNEIDGVLGEILSALRGLNPAIHKSAKLRLRRQAMAAMREAIDRELTLEAYRARAATLSAVALPG
jgi:enoyl-CoA hydratase